MTQIHNHVVFCYFLLLIAPLFAKLPWPGDSEGFFRLQLKLPPAQLFTTRGGDFTLTLLMLNVKQVSFEKHLLVFRLIQPRIEPMSTVSIADTLST